MGVNGGEATLYIGLASHQGGVGLFLLSLYPMGWSLPFLLPIPSIFHALPLFPFPSLQTLASAEESPGHAMTRRNAGSSADVFLHYP